MSRFRNRMMPRRPGRDAVRASPGPRSRQVCGSAGRAEGKRCANLPGMDIQTILDCLNSVAVRATYGAVGEVLGVRPQVLPRLLGARRPEASWVVNGTTGEPTGYAPEEVDPRLPGTHVIRTGAELRACLDGAAPASSEAAPAAPEAAPPAAAPVVNAAAGPAMPESEPFAMNSDARWIIGTLVPVFLLVAGLLAAQIASVNRGLNTRIDEVHDRIDDLMENVAAVDTRVDDVRTGLRDEIAVLRSDLDSIAARLPGVDPAPPATGADPAPDAGAQAVDPAAPEAASDSPDAAPEPAAEPQPEPAADPDASEAAPAPPGE